MNDPDPDQDILDFYNQSKGSPGSPTATMTPDPDQDILDFYNKSRSPTPTATTAPSRSPYTDKAVQDQSAALSSAGKPGVAASIGGAAVRGFLPGRAMLAAYPVGSVLGAAAVGAARGALVGAAVPVAGETGISEAIGGVIGGLIAGGIAAWGVSKAQGAVADVVSPGGVFSTKTEQAQVAAHPYASIVGGGLSFGKPNPMNVVRAGKTLASAEGRAALVAFTKSGGKGMSQQAVDEAGNVINVAMAGGLNSAFNVKDQIESGHFDPTQLAVAAATGLIFNEPWFHKANPSATAAAKVIAKSGVPGVAGVTTAPPEPPVTPGVVPPPTPRVPGLFDFETAGPPRTETMRAPEAPLPEAPIPKPGTEGGDIYAPKEGPVAESSVEQYPGVSPGENVPTHPEEVRKVGGEQAGDRGGVGAAAEEPVAGIPPEHPLARLTEEERNDPKMRKLIVDDKTLTDEQKSRMLATGTWEYLRDAPKEQLPPPKVMEVQKSPETLAAEEEPLFPKPKVKVDPRMQRLEQIENEVNDYYDRQELPPKALHDERKALEAQLQKEHEAELLKETQAHQQKGGDELLDAVAEHGVPLNDPAFPGELRNLKEHFSPKGKYGQEKHRKAFSGERLNFGDVFKADAGSMDSLTQFLKRKGFDVETPDDTIQLLDERLRSGKKIYGDEARAQELEDQSFQDYQGPMYTKHPFGGAETPEPGGISKSFHEKLMENFRRANAIKAREAENLRNDPVKQDKVISEVVAKEPDVHIDSTPGRRIVSTSQDEDQVDRLLGKDAYKSSIVNVVIKELLQNGFDAVREGGASELKPGQIAIDYDYDSRTITVRDNGVGMDPETIVTAFLRTGGSKKSGDFQNTSGGLGVAKIAFLKGSKRIKLVTVKDGLKTVMDVDQAQIKAKQIPLDSSYTNEPNGTTVRVEIPDKYVDVNGETQDVWFDTDPDFLKNPLFGPVEVTINGERSPMGIHTEGWEKDNRFNFRWGHADVYVDPRPLGKYSWGEERDPKYSVMSAGLHQFDVSWGKIFDKADERIPNNVVIDVRPHVDPKAPDYPFNNQREGWRGTVERDAAAIYAFLEKMGVDQRLKKSQEKFSKIKVMPKIPMVELGKDLTPEQVAQNEISQGEKGSVTLPKVTSVDVEPDKVVTNYATGKSSVQSHEQFNKSTFSAEKKIDFEKSKLDTSHLDSDAPLYHNNTNVKFEDIKGAPEFHAKLGNMFVEFMREFGRMVSKEPNSPIKYQDLLSTDPAKRWFGGISYDTEYAGLNIMYPFRSLWINPGGVSEGALAGGPKRAAMETLHTFLHEITHIPQRNEGSGFTREETNNIGRLADFPHQKFIQALEQVYTKHWGTLNEINFKLADANTKNSAESFQAGAQLESESKRGKGSDKGVPAEHAPEDVGLQKEGPTGAGRAGEPDRKIGSIGDILSGQKSTEIPGAEPAHPENVAPQAQPGPVIPPAAPVSEGVGGRSGVAGIKETLAGIKEAAAQPPETPEQRQFAPHPVETGDVEPRPPTANEAAGPGLRDMSEQQMSQVISNSLQQFHEDPLAPDLYSSSGLSHNDLIDAGRQAIRHGVDPEAVVNSRAIPEDQKYTVVRAHGEDLRDVAVQAEDFARKNPSQMNKDAADAAFADYSNWDNEHVRPLRQAVDEKYPGMPPEEYNPRSMTDLRQEMFRKNNRDFSTSERRTAEANLKEIERTVEARNKELMKRDAELAKASPDLVREIKNGDDLFKYLTDILCP